MASSLIRQGFWTPTRRRCRQRRDRRGHPSQIPGFFSYLVYGASTLMDISGDLFRMVYVPSFFDLVSAATKPMPLVLPPSGHLLRVSGPSFSLYFRP